MNFILIIYFIILRFLNLIFSANKNTIIIHWDLSLFYFTQEILLDS